MRAKSFIKTSVKLTETKIDEGTWKKIVTQSVHLEEHCAKIETTFQLFYARLFLTNLVFEFNIVLIGIFFQKQPPEVFYKKGVLRNFVKLTGKHLCQSIFFNKVAGLISGTGVLM